MSGESVDELLVKLGLETDARGFREANNQLTMIRTTALAMGAAAIGAGVGLGRMSADVAKSVDGLGKWSNAMDVGLRKAQQLKFALELAGSANPEAEMMSMFENIEGLRTQAMRGELSDWALYESGMDLYQLRDMDNEQALEYLMRGLSQINDPDAQRRALGELNFSSPAQHGIMTNYAGTIAAFNRSDELGQADADLAEKSAAYLDAMTELKTATNDLKNMVADKLLPHMAEWVKALTGGVQEYKPAAANATAILLGEGSSLEKMEALSDDPEVSKVLGDFWSWFKEWNLAVKYSLSAAEAFDEYTKEKTGATLGERWDAATKAREEQQRRLQRRSSPAPGSGRGLSLEELNYEPSASELIPQGNRSELIEGYKRLLHEDLTYGAVSAVPDFGRSTQSQSKSTSLTVNVDARGSTDPGLTAERVRGVVRDEVGRMVSIEQDNMPIGEA